jgi:hypothetical protein
MNRRRNILVVSIAALALTLASTAAAGNGWGNGGGKDPSSLSLVMVSDANGNGVPNWGDTVTFDVSTTATSQPSVIADCYQNGALVYRHFGFFYGDPSPSRNFVFQSGAWTGGAAGCTATLYYMDPHNGTEVDLATLPFNVGA